MTKKNLYLTILTVLVCIFALTSCEGKGEWTTVTRCNTDFENNLDAFINETDGITVGRYGTIKYTRDSGKTWTQTDKDMYSHFNVDYVTNDLIWCGGEYNHIKLSRDGGKSWTPMPDFSMAVVVSNIDFLDDKVGWATTTDRPASTTDGGKTWERIYLPDGADGVVALCLRTKNDGYVYSRNGIFCITHDGGKTWETTDTHIEDFNFFNQRKEPKLIEISAAICDIVFTDENNGIIVFAGACYGNGSEVWCLRTKDGGKTFTREQVPVDEGFETKRVFLTEDGQYLTLGNYDKEIIVMKYSK